jgi:LysR family transcriptional regulator, glycine cleavage system transcriptional activator
LALSTVVAGDLRAGRLVKPFAVAVPTPFAYYVVCPEATAERPKVAALRRWLRTEVQRDLDGLCQADPTGGAGGAAAGDRYSA